jgi:hypothetical protein
MRRSTCFLLVVFFGSWSSSLGQNATKLTHPRIVATFERLGQTAGIGPTAIYTPKRWGTFRISIVMVGTVGNQMNAYWLGALSFIDAAGENGGPNTPFEVMMGIDIPRTSSVEFPIRAKPGKPLEFSVSSSGDTSGTKYNVWVVVEQLM